MKIIRAEGGTGEKQVDVDKIHIHDLWGVAMDYEGETQKCILDVWHLAHDLLGALRAIANEADITKPIHTK